MLFFFAVLIYETDVTWGFVISAEEWENIGAEIFPQD